MQHEHFIFVLSETKLTVSLSPRSVCPSHAPRLSLKMSSSTFMLKHGRYLQLFPLPSTQQPIHPSTSSVYSLAKDLPHPSTHLSIHPFIHLLPLSHSCCQHPSLRWLQPPSTDLGALLIGPAPCSTSPPIRSQRGSSAMLTRS